VSARTRSGHVVVVDVGTNAVRLSLARITAGVGFTVLREAREQTRLGGGRSGALPARAIAATVATVERFLRKVRRGHEPRVIAVATSAVREAHNAAALRAALRRRAAVDVSVLTGEEEARLGGIAAVRSLGLRNATVIDLGGGSLQISRVDDGVVTAVASVPLGAVRLTRHLLHDDPPTDAAVAAVRRETARQVAGRLPPAATHPLVGLGGTIRTLGRMHLAGRRRRSLHRLTLPAAAVHELCATLVGAPYRTRRSLPGLRAHRADIIVAGALVVDELLARGGYPALTVCTRGVRHGVLIRETFGITP